MTEAPGAPIVVRKTAKLELFWTCVRIGLFVVAGLLLRPYVPDVLLGVIGPYAFEAFAGVLALAGTLFVSIRQTLSKHRKLATLAEAAPADLAVTK